MTQPKAKNTSLTNRLNSPAAVFIIILASLAIFVAIVLNTAPPTTAIQVAPCLANDAGDCRVFPTVSGENLLGETLTFPDAFQAPYNLVLMPFNRDQQVSAQAWLPFAQSLKEDFADLQYYSIAALPDLDPAIRLLVTGGMNLAINDTDVRQVATVLFLEEQDRFITALGLDYIDSTQLILFKQSGEMLWQMAISDYNATQDTLIRDALQQVGVLSAS